MNSIYRVTLDNGRVFFVALPEHTDSVGFESLLRSHLSAFERIQSVAILEKAEDGALLLDERWARGFER